MKSKYVKKCTVIELSTYDDHRVQNKQTFDHVIKDPLALMQWQFLKLISAIG